MSRDRILPIVLAVWGAAIVLRNFVVREQYAGAYGQGHHAANVFAVVMLLFGLYRIMFGGIPLRRRPPKTVQIPVPKSAPGPPSTPTASAPAWRDPNTDTSVPPPGY